MPKDDLVYVGHTLDIARQIEAKISPVAQQLDPLRQDDDSTV